MKTKFWMVLVTLLGVAELTAAAQQQSRPLVSFMENGKYGLIDARGEVVLKPQYDFINTKVVYAGGSVLVRIADSCFVVNMDTKTTSLFADLRHQPAQKLNPAMIAQGDKFGYIDVKGKVIIEGQWDYASPFRDGMARVVIGSGYIYAPSYYPSPGKTGFIDTAGRYVILPEYS